MYISHTINNNSYIYNVELQSSDYKRIENIIKTKRLKNYSKYEFHFLPLETDKDSIWGGVDLDENKIYIFWFTWKTDDELIEIIDHELLHIKYPSFTESIVLFFTKKRKF